MQNTAEDREAAQRVFRSVKGSEDMTLYDGTRNKLDYVVNKLYSKVHDFYVNGIEDQRFTPNEEETHKLDDELYKVASMAATGEVTDWKLVKKYVAIADEFRTGKVMRTDGY